MTRRLTMLLTVIPAAMLAAAGAAGAGEAPAITAEQAGRAASTWLEVLRAEGFDGADLATVTDVRPLAHDHGVVAWVADLEPPGYVLLASSSAFAPVKAFSLGHGFDLDSPGLGALLLDEMASERAALTAARREGSSLGAAPHEQWRPLLEGRPDGASKNAGSSRVDPMVTARWGQFSPYSDLCPDACTGRTVVGCVATAISQVMYYWRHPAHGFGSHSYLWDGDGCPGYRRVLSADFSDPYDWANMHDEVFRDSPPAQRQAVAELSYEVGVSVESDYGVVGTGALVANAVTALPAFFGYHPGVNRVNRRDLPSDHDWFEVFRQQLDLGRPVLLALRGWREGDPGTVIQHAVVADGYFLGWPSYVHLNLGWSHWYDDWYLLDSIVTGSTHWTLLDLQFAVRDIVPDACVTPPAPTGLEVTAGPVSSGQTYRVGWSALDGAVSYELEEDLDPAFPSPVVTRTSGLFHLLAHEVEAPATYFYRVRGSGGCGHHMLPSEWSPTRSVTVAPEEDPGPDPVIGHRRLVPGVARLAGVGGSAWHSSLTAVNRTSEPVDALLTLRTEEGDHVAAVSFEPGEQRLWDDVVLDLWGVTSSAAGAVEVRSTGPLLVNLRTYNRSGGGSFGQYLPACGEADVIGRGEVATLAPVRAGSGWRTNIGFVQLGADSCRVALRLMGADGAPRGRVLEVVVPAGRWLQVGNVAHEAAAGLLEPGHATVAPLDEGCAVWAYASVVEGVTGDPTTVPMAVD